MDGEPTLTQPHTDILAIVKRFNPPALIAGLIIATWEKRAGEKDK
jgi:hypothetical protein